VDSAQGTAAWEALRQQTTAYAKKRIGKWAARYLTGRAVTYGSLRQRRERSNASREAALAIKAVREALETLQRVLAIQDPPAAGFFLDAQEWMRKHGGPALEGLPPCFGFGPVEPEETEWTAIDLVLGQFWMSLNGGEGHCRVCDARVVAGEPCSACGAEACFACSPLRGSKVRPSDLALFLILEGPPDAEWKAWARDTTEPKDVHGTLANRIRVRLSALRTKLRARHRQIIR
jgi:hypothetical protein